MTEAPLFAAAVADLEARRALLGEAVVESGGGVLRVTGDGLKADPDAGAAAGHLAGAAADPRPHWRAREPKARLAGQLAPFAAAGEGTEHGIAARAQQLQAMPWRRTLSAASAAT